MRRFFFFKRETLARAAPIQPGRLLVLPLLQQRQLLAQGNNLLLLAGHGVVKCGHGILQESHLALQVYQLLLQLFYIGHLSTLLLPEHSGLIYLPAR